MHIKEHRKNATFQEIEKQLAEMQKASDLLFKILETDFPLEGADKFYMLMADGHLSYSYQTETP